MTVSWKAIRELMVGALLVLALAPAVHADDQAAMKARMAELEARQAEMLEEMKALREQLEAATEARAAQPAAAVVDSPATEATDSSAVEAAASPTAQSSDARVEQVERKQSVITEEVRKLKEALVLPESGELKSQWGLGPAASKVYNITKGVSLAGYGEFNYKNVVDNKGSSNDEFDMLRLVLYTGYKFNDNWLMNAEIEFEHASTGKDGSVSVEFATIDYLHNRQFNARAGLVLIPMGFINEIHEPLFFHGNLRPQVEQQILPSTWRSGGVGIFGELIPGLEYRTYAVTGFDAKGFRNSGLRGGRQSGSKERAEDWAWVGRLDYSPVEQLTIGGSAYVGNSGQGQRFGNSTTGFFTPDVFTQIYEGHLQFRMYGFETRFLGAWSSIDDADILSTDSTINPGFTDLTKPNQAVSSEQWGWYGEVAYDLVPLVFPESAQYLAPWFRYTHYDTQGDVPAGFPTDNNYDRDIYEVGLSWKPFNQVVFKLDYRNQGAAAGSQPDEVRIGGGFIY